MQGWADPPLTPAGLGEGSIADAHNLRIPITLHGISGLIAVSITRSTDPDALGYLLLTGGQPTDAACGFPVCRATVTYPAEGYAAMFGWTQMVRSTDSDPDRFEMDPIALYRQVLTPYAFFGVRPELFDAPSRDSKYDMDWLAHSFLCVSPDAVLTRHVQAIAGFTWASPSVITTSRLPCGPDSSPTPGTATSTCSEPATPAGSSTVNTSPPD